VFETPVPRHLQGRLGGPHAPHPFIFTPLDEGDQPLEPGTPLSFGVTLVGRGIRYLSYFLAAFERMGHLGLGVQRLPFEVEEVLDGFDAEGRAIFDPKLHRVLAAPTVRDLSELTERALTSFQNAPGHGRAVRLRLLTPLRLTRNGELSEQLDLPLVVGALYRRLEALTLFHGEGSAAWTPPSPAGSGATIPGSPAPRSAAAGLLSSTPDSSPGWPMPPAESPSLPIGPDSAYSPAPPGSGRALCSAAERAGYLHADLGWALWERRSNRQRRQIEMDGLIGEASLRDVPPSVLAWLLAGQWLGVGKSTSFGLGRYAVEALDEESAS
jgi:hypothetical protein